jgi:hypothetical protein
MGKLNSSIELIFAEALAAFDTKTIEGLLHEKGTFPNIVDIMDDKKVNKETFLEMLQWKITQQKAAGLISVNYITDQCIYCNIGCNVFIYEEGKFPVNRNRMPFKEKTVLVVSIKSKKIHKLILCNAFLKTENKLYFDVSDAPF